MITEVVKADYLLESLRVEQRKWSTDLQQSPKENKVLISSRLNTIDLLIQYVLNNPTNTFSVSFAEGSELLFSEPINVFQ